MPLEQKDQLLNKLGSITEPLELFKEIISLGQKAPPYPEEFRKDDFLIEGCFSQIWLHPYYQDGLVYFDYDADAAIPKGITAVLVNILDACTPEEIQSFESSFLKEVGIDQHLSSNRRNGLANLMKRMKESAR